jgi:hypothetical protein
MGPALGGAEFGDSSVDTFAGASAASAPAQDGGVGARRGKPDLQLATHMPPPGTPETGRGLSESGAAAFAFALTPHSRRKLDAMTPRSRQATMAMTPSSMAAHLAKMDLGD